MSLEMTQVLKNGRRQCRGTVGMEAAGLGFWACTPRGEEFDRKQVLEVPLTGRWGPSTSGFMAEYIIDTFQRMKYKRSVPQGRARKELYQMAME